MCVVILSYQYKVMSDLFADQAENLLGKATSTVKSVTKTSSGYYYYIGIVVAIIILGAVLFWYLRKRPDLTTVYGPYVLGEHSMAGGKPEKIFTAEQIERSLGNNFTLGFFLYMDEVNKERIPFAGPTGEYRGKPLVYIQGVGDISVDPIHQSLRVSIRPLVQSEGRFEKGGVVELDIDNFMIARWNQVAFTIEGRTVDVYINGALAKSSLLENLPILNPAGVLLETSPDFSGQAGLFQAWPRRLTEHEIINNYKRNTDTRLKPRIPDKWSMFGSFSFCKTTGLCGVRIWNNDPLKYVEYDFA